MQYMGSGAIVCGFMGLLELSLDQVLLEFY